MSEQRRATLTPFGKSDKNSKTSPRKTFRFSFTLFGPSEGSCPVFDYGLAVKTEERKFIKKHCEAKRNGVLDQFGDEDDVKKLAQKFEEKYGDKKKKCKSYAELGAGYDETDPFIDNTEAYDEAIQEDQETPCGGYYINSGPLELKRVEMSDQSDADEVGKRRQKKLLPVIEEDEENKEEEEGDKEKQEQDNNSPELKKSTIYEERGREEENGNHSPNELEEPVKKRKKRLISDDKVPGDDFTKIKKARTVKDLLEEKRAQEPSVTEEPKKQIASITSISEAIESVVNASNNDENSNSSNSSKSAIASTSSEDSQDGKTSSQIAPPPLPENLSPELVSLVEQVRHMASVTDNTRKTFSVDINNTLVKLEWKSREFSSTNRNLLFSHLACYLPCTKDTLMRRAKKLFIHKEESQIDTIICKLKATIDATMPSLLEKYGKECQRIAEEKGIGAIPNCEVSLCGENQQTPELVSAKLPKRKFLWTEETRGYLREIVRLKNRCYKVLKPRKSTSEEYVTSFLHTKIRTLWPQGWMKTQILLRESSRSPHSGKPKHSSSHGSSKGDSSRLNISKSYPSPSPSNGSPMSLFVSPNDTTHQPTRSPLAGSTPLTAKNGADPLNLLTKITTSLSTSPNHHNKSPTHHQNSKSEKPELFSMDCLLKRTSESTNCNNYSTTKSELIKKDSVIMNGASLPLKNVNSSQVNSSCKNDNILDLSSCNSSVSGTSVIQTVPISERTAMRASDSVSLNIHPVDSSKIYSSATSPCRKEVRSDLPLNRKQRLLQLSTQPNSHSQGSCDNVISKKTDKDLKWPQSAHKASVVESKKPMAVMEDVERRLTEETTTATDILSQIINESLRTPLQPSSTTPYSIKPLEEIKSVTSPQKNQELFYDVMQDLKELNHMSSGGILDNKQDNKSNSYTGASWAQTKKPSEGLSKSSQYHNEFLKHLLNTHDVSLPPTPTPPYSRHTVSPYENSQYMNEINKSIYNSTTHRTTQSVSSHSGSPTKLSPIKPLPNTAISPGHPHRYMSQMDYGPDDQHLLGLASNLQYGLAGWPYSGNESQSHQ